MLGTAYTHASTVHATTDLFVYPSRPAHSRTGHGHSSASGRWAGCQLLGPLSAPPTSAGRGEGSAGGPCIAFSNHLSRRSTGAAKRAVFAASLSHARPVSLDSNLLLHPTRWRGICHLVWCRRPEPSSSVPPGTGSPREDHSLRAAVSAWVLRNSNGLLRTDIPIPGAPNHDTPNLRWWGGGAKVMQDLKPD